MNRHLDVEMIPILLKENYLYLALLGASLRQSTKRHQLKSEYTSIAAKCVDLFILWLHSFLHLA